ncbi:biopolymer transporter ExbD [Vibrio parahaemolyticus]|uniref:ExbD/TolR family protein n=1 Tax=Vibrio parahaemolyticus TaxID=670 RepID=UPI001E52B43B|nr:biopolymer transporter ExbD [Vibrio parahaemolyticus]MCD1416904.1 biopolymer transporter ExbD [Vibrio parahaemolyticus]
MKFSPFKQQHTTADVDLDITPFLSLMVVLIPVLLVSVKFSLLAQYDVHSEPLQLPQEEVAQMHDESASAQPYRLEVKEDVLTLSQGEVTYFEWQGLSEREALVSAFTEAINELDVKAQLFIQLQATHSYQDMVSLLDMLHQHEAVFSSVSITVKEGV